MNEFSKTGHEIHELIEKRWSPRAFSGAPMSDADWGSLLEAARWAPSSFNEQPWRFIVAKREDQEEFGRVLSCIAEKNAEWAKNAAVLMLSVTKTTFARNGKPNRHALHDVGLAVAQLTLQATALGIGVHQMAGFSADRARELYGIPAEFEPVTAIAVGYPSEQKDAHDRELTGRSRLGLKDLVFAGAWESPVLLQP